MTLKELYQLFEISQLPQRIGKGDLVSTPANTNNNSNPSSALLTSHSDERIALREKIWQHAEQGYRRIHGRDPVLVWAYALTEGADEFLVIWDHWQSYFMKVICGRRPAKPSSKAVF